jgi:PAS domain S-box-containing protein
MIQPQANGKQSGSNFAMHRFRLATMSCEGVFLLMLLAIFVTELAVMVLLSTLFLPNDAYSAGILDAVILALLYASPLWAFVVHPLAKRDALSFGGISSGVVAWLLIAALVGGVFLTEFMVMLALPFMLPHPQGNTATLVDAGITTLVMAFPIWWLTCSKRMRRYKVHSADLLGTPMRLYALLLVMVFVTDLVMDFLYPYLFPYLNHSFYVVVDSFISTLLMAPLLLWFLIAPLQARNRHQKARVKAIYAQAVDAIMTLDANGTIESVNPAAERIFGYSAEELAGRRGTLLFEGEGEGIGELISRGEVSRREGHIVAFEATGRRKDGSIVTMDVSFSRILVEGETEHLVIIRDISDRKRMEKELEESEERFTLAINGSNEGIWDWNILTDSVYCSPRFRELLGYRADEMNNDFAEFASALHPDDHDRVMAALRSHLEQDTPYDMEYRLQTKSGTYRWFLARGQVVRNAAGRPVRMAGSISDISVQKAAAEALRESEVRFRQIFEQSEDAIIFFKPHSSSILDVNVTAEKLYGYTKSEMQESGLSLITRPEDYSLLTNAIRNIGKDKIAQLEKIVNLRRDGSEIFVSMRGKVVQLQGVDVIYCSFRDVTERLRMETEAREIQAKLIQANKMTSLGLLVSGVAHEINNPNSFIMANSQLLERSWADALKILQEYYRENGEFYVGGVPFSEMQVHSPKLFAGITDGAKRIESIINNLKKFARNGGPVERVDVNVNQVATSAVSILHYELNKFTDNFHVELGENIPLIKGNSQQLGQIIINLLMNAGQALQHRRGGVWLTTGFDAEAGQVLITVKDEGQGMSPEKSRMIMEPFFTTKLDSGGTGLGLSICQSIIRDHSWSLDFTSEPGAGTIFYLRIPVATVAEKEGSA